MNQLPFSPYLWTGLGLVFLFVAYRATRKKKILSSAGGSHGSDDYRFYLKVFFAWVGGVLLLVVATIRFYETMGWTAAILAVLSFSGLAALVYYAGQIRKGARLQFRRAILREKRIKPGPLGEVKVWALATTGIPSKVAGRDLSSLGGKKPGPKAEKWALRRLRKHWDIVDEESYEEIQEWLLETGHRMEFHTLIDRISAGSDEFIERYLEECARGEHGVENATELAEEKGRVEMIQQFGGRLKQQGFLAWDYIRYIENCRTAFLAGLVEEEEAWDQILSAAQVLQTRYDSWHEMAEVYLDARQFWSVVEDEKSGATYRKAFDRLTSDKKSPWLNLSWDLPLFAR
ncbi:MAG: DUF1266 domain-containing protein [Bacteroidota bacterium]